MKRIQIITGTLLLMLMAGNSPLYSQRGMRGIMQDSAGIKRMRMEMRRDTADMRHMRHGMGPQWYGPVWRSPLRGGMSHMWMNPPMGRGMGRIWMNPGMRGGMGPMQWGPMGRGTDSVMMRRMQRNRMGMNGYMLEKIPNLTDNQKSAIEKIRADNQAEMQRFREETAAKMKSLREKNRERILDQLTPEQKKWFQSNVPDQPGE